MASELKSNGEKSANTVGGNSTHVSGANSTINYYGGAEYYNGKHIKTIDIIKSQRAVIEKLQYQIDRMQTQIDTTQDIKNKLVMMLMNLLDEHKNQKDAKQL